MAVTLVVAGISRILMAFQLRGQGAGWAWVLLTRLISIAQKCNAFSGRGRFSSDLNHVVEASRAV
jgi:hypothetical protein